VAASAWQWPGVAAAAGCGGNEAINVAWLAVGGGVISGGVMLARRRINGVAGGSYRRCGVARWRRSMAPALAAISAGSSRRRGSAGGMASISGPAGSVAQRSCINGVASVMAAAAASSAAAWPSGVALWRRIFISGSPNNPSLAARCGASPAHHRWRCILSAYLSEGC